MEDIWGSYTLEEGKVRYFSAGNLHLWIKWRGDELWIAHTYNDEQPQPVDNSAPPEKVGWARWANKWLDEGIQLLPVFADLPLVVHSEYSLKVSPNTDIQIFTRIPVWVRVSLAKNDYKFIELPTVKASRTWFGSPVEGELCYHSSTKARRNLSDVEKKPYVVSCPIQIVNNTYENLDFEHFCFRVERLGIYQHENQLWADQTKIEYQGDDLHSDVTMTGKLPKGIKKKELMSKPRQRVQKSLATRTFRHLLEETHLIGR